MLGILCAICIIPFMVGAETAPEREKINIYIFHGDGCQFCAGALAFFDSIEEEYGAYYNLVKFETWHNEKNANVLDQLSEHYNIAEKKRGVPFILIGDKYFNGYDSAWDDDIKQAIMTEYNNEKRSSVVADYVKYLVPDGSTQAPEEEKNNDAVILVVTACIIVGAVGLIVFARKRSE